MDIEPLLARLEALAPSFGRAEDDIRATVSRGRSEDYKGVMQNCRLVLEALLRALVSDHLKQTPGKAMLDELITKFRQQANAGVIPMNILAHMGTVQAWGNLSSHDQATKLTDDGVKVGKGEVMASLNSMVAILDWYAAAFGPRPAPGAQPTSLAPARAAAAGVAAGPKKAPVVPIAIGVVVLAAIGAGGFFATRPTAAVAPPIAAVTPVPAVSPFVALDALYAKWSEPKPPAACRSAKDAAVLAANPTDLTALEALPDNRSAEAWYVIARAQLDQKLDAAPALKHALECERFAAAHNLQGKIAIMEGRAADALTSFTTAVAIAPGFAKARYNLAIIHLKEQRIGEGMKELQRATTDEPKFADAHYLLARAYQGQKQMVEANAEFCAAADHGHQEAQAKCER